MNCIFLFICLCGPFPADRGRVAMSWFKKKGHQRLESKGGDDADDTFEAISADWMHTEGSISEVLGLSLTEAHVIEKVESHSPFANKFKAGDTVISVNNLDTASSSVHKIIEDELTSGKTQFSFVALRARTGTVQTGIKAEGGAWEGK